MITWLCIVAAVVLYFMVKLFVAVHHRRQLHTAAVKVHKHYFIEMGSEREELFVAGDPLHEDDDCDEDEPEL